MAPKPGSSHSSSSSLSSSSSSSSSNSSFLRRAVSVRCVASVLYLLVAAAALTAVARFYRLRLAAGVAAAPLPSLAAVFRNPGRAFAQVVGPSASAAGGLGGPGAGAGAAAPASAAELRRARRAERKAQRESFKDTAIVTLATGDAAARHAVVLIKTLRDTGTLIPRIVVLLSRGGMGSADCHNETLRNKRNRHYHCSSPLAEADDIVSQRYLDAFARMGVEVRIIDPIKDTKYTALIPGGRATFWGMSFNKLRIFNMTEFRKILFIDADVLVLRNIDHVMLEPDFTAAFTTECCNNGARGKLGGGMWIFTPSYELWNRTMAMINTPCPDSEGGTWVHADMDVVNYLFCDIQDGLSFENWPFTRDMRQGVVPGLRYFPAYRNQSEEDFLRLVGFPTSGLPAPEGLLPQHSNLSQVWRLLDARFDGLVGNCECMGDRDMPDVAFTVHFSCMAVFSKPGHFSSDRDFQTVVYNRGKSCTRFYYMHWYNAYRSMMGPLPEPLYEGPPVPIWNKTHDDLWVEPFRTRMRAEQDAANAGNE